MRRFIYARALQSKGNITVNNFYYIDVNHIISLDCKYETKCGAKTEVPTYICMAAVDYGHYSIDFAINENDYRQLKLLTVGD